MFNEIVRAEIWLQDTLDSQESIAALAERLGYSTSQVRRRFRQYFGMSPSAYREALRLEKASRLLVHTPLGIGEVARRSGYTNHSAFSRAFLRRFRRSPREHRQLGRTALAEATSGARMAFSPRIQRVAPCSAVVARQYEPSAALPAPDSWLKSLGGYQLPLPGAPERAAAIMLLHAPCPETALPRRDIGVLVDSRAADSLAIPPSLRLLQLPEARLACLDLPDPAELEPTLARVLATLPEISEHYSGDPVRLIKGASGVELQLPLLEIG
ncbi:helix-turn-helix transcriptional regulator [Halomonas sp. H10-9-1]|uniref:helix-turn-helix transcriptional regulator n=1 Tax=Halomonas sp. H10-9-1 TaxID=2950871 RepID=UPI0032DF2FA5